MIVTNLCFSLSFRSKEKRLGAGLKILGNFRKCTSSTLFLQAHYFTSCDVKFRSFDSNSVLELKDVKSEKITCFKWSTLNRFIQSGSSILFEFMFEFIKHATVLFCERHKSSQKWMQIRSTTWQAWIEMCSVTRLYSKVSDHHH